MRRTLHFVLLLGAFAAAGSVAAGQVVVDRIVARIEKDIITLSDVRELAAYQRLNGRQPPADAELIRLLAEVPMPDLR